MAETVAYAWRCVSCWYQMVLLIRVRYVLGNIILQFVLMFVCLFFLFYVCTVQHLLQSFNKLNYYNNDNNNNISIPIL